MRKTPSYLKGLAETRARAATDVLSLRQVISEPQGKLAQAETELAACDTLIQKFDGRLDPSSIGPINHWQGRYGKRGALRQAVLQVLSTSPPASSRPPRLGGQSKRSSA